MAGQKQKRVKRKLTDKQKAGYADVSRKIEAEFPPGKARLPRENGSEPPAAGEYFDLRRIVAELKKAREAQGLSLRDIQERTGIERSAISRIENGENVNPTINTLTRYARAVDRLIEIRLREPQPAETEF